MLETCQRELNNVVKVLKRTKPVSFKSPCGKDSEQGLGVLKVQMYPA